jgi:hypothetical protein
LQDSVSILDSQEVIEEGWDDGFEGLRQEVRSSQPVSQASSVELTAIEKELEIWNQVIQGPKNREINIDILGFWKKTEPSLPLLSWLARRVFCIPASSSASERAFSTGGKVVSPSRTLLNAEMAEDLIWLKKNFDVLDPLIRKYVLRMSEYRIRDKESEAIKGKDKEKEKEKADEKSSAKSSGSDTEPSEAGYDSDAVVSIYDTDSD